MATQRKADGTKRTKRATDRERRAVRQARQGGPSAKPPKPSIAKRNARNRNNRRCEGLNIFGEPCGSSPLKPGTEVEGVKVSGKWCLKHDADVPDGAWRRLVQDPAARVRRAQRQPRPMELLAAAVNKAPAILFKAHLDSLGLEWDEETLQLVRTGDGAKIVGFSREGVARVSKHRDLTSQRQAEKELMDRLFGKPRQAMELAGGGTAAIVQIPQDPDRQRAVARVLMEAGAVKAEINVGDDDDV